MEVKTRKKIKGILFTQRTYTEGSNGGITQLFDSPVGSVGNVVPGYSIQLASRDNRGKWTINNLTKLTEFYNNANGSNLSEKEVNRQFYLSIAPVANNDSASILNANSNYSSQQTAITNRSSYAKNGLPGVIDPVTQKKTNSKGDPQSQPTVAAPPQTQDPNKPPIQTPSSGNETITPGSVDAPGPADGPVPIPVIPYKEPEPKPLPEQTNPNNQTAAPTNKLLRYPLANLDVVGQELGIGYDFIKISIVDHVRSLGSLLEQDLGSGGATLDQVNATAPNNQQEGNGFEKQISLLTNGDVSDLILENSTNIYSTIILPMQPNLSTSNSVDWATDSMNIAQLVGGQLASNYFGGLGGGKNPAEGLQALTTQFMQSLSTFANTAKVNKSTIATLLAGYLVGSEGIFKRASGTVINPNMEMLFNGPRMRTFNFQFDMTPRFKEESDQIKEIIRTFKKYMSPKKTPGNAFLLAPKIFLLEYIYNGNGGVANGDGHPFLNRFKPCALTEFNVNYTPDGSYMTYGDNGSMTKYTISMSFSEISPIYQDDYDSKLGSIGMGY